MLGHKRGIYFGSIRNVVVVMACLLLASCGRVGGAASSSGSSHAGSTSATSATVGKSDTSGSNSGVLIAESAPGVTINISSAVRTSDVRNYKGGGQTIRYDLDDDAAPYTVMVDNYHLSDKSASALVGEEQEAFKQGGAVVESKDVSVSGGSNAHRLDWTQQAQSPWQLDDKAPSISIACTAVIFEGPQNYTYGVYVMADASKPESLKSVQKIIDSITVN